MWQSIEPLGMNCELGFALNHFGAKEGRLFKWCFTSLESLEKALSFLATNEDVFSGDIDFNLSQDNDLVRFEKSGIYFHAKEAKDLARICAAESNKSLRQSLDLIIEREICKYKYLQHKFVDRLQQIATIHIYALSGGGPMPDTDSLFAIHQLLLNAGKPKGAKTLIALSSSQTDLNPSPIHTIGPDCHLGIISRFAPIDKSFDIDATSWDLMIERFSKTL